MDMQAIKDEVLLKLTGNVVNFELPDSALTKIINSSLREVQRYINTVAMISVPFSKCIDLTKYKVNSVIGIRRTEGYLSDESSNESYMLDPMYASQWQILTGLGNVGRMTDYTYNYASWNTINQIRNTTSTDLAFMFSKIDNKLYINVSTNLPEKITILYIPRFNDVSEITSDFWIDILIRLSVAQAKVIVGRVRSKFKQSNALWVLDGDSLIEEGNAELNTLREQLRESTDLYYGMD